MSNAKPPYRPPRWPDRILARFCAPHLLEEVMGDLHERYYLNVKKIGEQKARKRYWRETLAYVRPTIFKRQPSPYAKPIFTDMIQNYLKIAFRSILKYKVYSALNILGLTIGLTCAIIISLFVYDEISFDKFHEKSKQIYRLGCTYYLPNNAGSEVNATMGPVVGPMMEKDYPEITQCVRIEVTNNKIIQNLDKTDRFFETIHYTDSNFFDLFIFPLFAGDPATALVEPFSMVISKEAALKYFNSTDVIGKALFLPEDSMQFNITGILEEIPTNSHLQFDFLASMQTKYSLNIYMESWWNFSTYTYMQVVDGTDIAALSDKIKFISREYIASQEDDSGYKQEYFLQQLEDIHLNSNLRHEISENNKASHVYIFLIVGIFILVIACINFMNLATARSATRAKEVGLRKVIGAYRPQLIFQFLGESLMITCFSLILSLATTFLGLSIINQFTEKQLSLSFTDNPILWIFILLVVLLVGLLAGLYPAVFLSSFQPIKTLKGGFKASANSNMLRKALVVFQFTISVMLITGSLVVFNQLNFMRNKELGFDKDRMIVIPTKFTNEALQNFTQLKEALEGYTEVKGTTLSSRVPGLQLSNNVVRIGWDDEAEWSDMRYLAVDYDFIKNYNLKIIAGREFDERYETDENEAFILNEAGMRRLGWLNPEEAIGKKLKWQRRRGYVVGIVKDFHFMSVNKAIEPFIIVMNGTRTPGYATIKLAGDQYKEALDLIETKYNEIIPYGVFEYNFLDKDFERQYKADQKFITIFSFFTVIAIVIACLGLYGLASFTAELKIKEIGIRKVLGASIKQVVILMSSGFTKLVLLAIAISIPIAYWGLNYWLRGFPYRITLSWWMFGMSGILAIFIAWFTISFQAIKAAIVNPVKSLRSE
ncbi:MAG: permease prefix domain 2-containing transporter [Bacteroidota bacterium]